MAGEFRHKIGDALYDLHTYDQPVTPDEGCEATVMHTIVKRTERYVYVHPFCDLPWRTPQDRLVRFSVADLEREGHAWNAANRMGLHTRPLPHWPLLVVSVDKPAQLALTAGTESEPGDLGSEGDLTCAR